MVCGDLLRGCDAVYGGDDVVQNRGGEIVNNG